MSVGVPAQTLKRSRLSARLVEEARSRGIPVHHGRRLVGVTLAADAAVARFADGGTLTSDVLVGADGVHSVVRRAIDPAAPAARYVGLTNFGGITRGVVPDGEREAWHMTLGRRAFFGWFPTPDGDTVWFVNWPRPPIGAEERARTTREEWRSVLADLLADDGGPAAALVRAGELELAADNTCDLPTVPAWHRGRAVLVGDAAHAPSPTSGQGAALGAEDGVVLAQALRDVPDVAAALGVYERHRRRRVERVVAVGARGSRRKAAGPVGRRVTNLLLPLVLRHLATERSTDWIHGHRIRWDRPLTATPAAGGGARR